MTQDAILLSFVVLMVIFLLKPLPATARPVRKARVRVYYRVPGGFEWRLAGIRPPAEAAALAASFLRQGYEVKKVFPSGKVDVLRPLPGGVIRPLS